MYGWISILMIPAGIAFAYYYESWWWLLLIPGSYAVWRANRTSMEQFFIENLQTNAEFYESMRRHMGDCIKVVLRTE
jgi:hypothetical protein